MVILASQMCGFPERSQCHGSAENACTPSRWTRPATVGFPTDPGSCRSRASTWRGRVSPRDRSQPQRAASNLQRCISPPADSRISSRWKLHRPNSVRSGRNSHRCTRAEGTDALKLPAPSALRIHRPGGLRGANLPHNTHQTRRPSRNRDRTVTLDIGCSGHRCSTSSNRTQGRWPPFTFRSHF